MFRFIRMDSVYEQRSSMRAGQVKRYTNDIGREHYQKICNSNERPKPRYSQGSLARSQKSRASDVNNQANTDLLCREIPRQFDKYYTQMKILKTLLAETRASFDEINQVGYFDFEDKESPLKVIENGDVGLSETLKKPPCIVILGQDNRAKATVVRELFGEQLIPPTQVNEDRELQRVAKFSFGRKQDYSLTTMSQADSTASVFELIEDESDKEDNLEGESGDYCHITRSVIDSAHSQSSSNPLSASMDSFKSALYKNIRLKSDERFNEHLGLAILEVKIPHAVLRAGGEVLVGPCNNPFMSTTEFFRRHVSEVFPILIYAMSYHKLGAEEMRELQRIRELRRDLAIFFIKAFDDQAEELTESAQDDVKNILKIQLIEQGFIQPQEHEGFQGVIIADG